YTAGDAVIEGGVLKTDLSISWPRHGILSFSKAPFKPRQGERNLPRIMGVPILLPRIMGVPILLPILLFILMHPHFDAFCNLPLISNFRVLISN
ncbi:hypothetical protein, partial [Shewanella algae]|uniref:hypothetical protein n=1 Tax=Shewanella algae TaxID=38313 RepID=UPI001C624E34